MSNEQGGAQIIDISDPANPEIIGVAGVKCGRVTVSGTIAYVTSASSGSE